jgi:hypothetical protein
MTVFAEIANAMAATTAAVSAGRRRSERTAKRTSRGRLASIVILPGPRAPGAIF